MGDMEHGDEIDEFGRMTTDAVRGIVQERMAQHDLPMFEEWLNRIRTEAWILVDPVQEYEESERTLGVFPSLEAAQSAPEVIDTESRRWDMQAQQWVPAPRMREVQHWAGSEMLGCWDYLPDTGEWKRVR